MVADDGAGEHKAAGMRGPTSRLRAVFCRGAGTATSVDRLSEAGALRLRLPRHAGACEGVILNTGGGVLGGDRLDLVFRLEPEAAAVLTTVAAEKIYRGVAEPSRIATRLSLAAGAQLDWLPQETILFDGAKLARSLAIDMAEEARLLAAEMLVFGRLAKGETAIGASLADDWRLRRGGRLVFADATRLDGAFGPVLDHPALGGGARAVALLLWAAPEAEAALDRLRCVLDAASGIAAGASARDGILVARLLAPSPEALRIAMVAALAALRGRAVPRVWQAA